MPSLSMSIAKGPEVAKFEIGRELIFTAAFALVTMVTPPENVTLPILSMLGILSTFPLLSQLKGGTKTYLGWLRLYLHPLLDKQKQA